MSNKFTVQERTQIAFKFETCKSVVGVQRWRRQIHGRNAKLNKRTIYACHERLVQTGTSFNQKKQTKLSKTKDANNIDTVRGILRVSPNKSVNQVKRECGLQVSCSTVYKIIKKELNFRPWKPHYVQELQVNDYARRLLFADQMEAWLRQTPTLLSNILWSDEAVFCVGGFVNRHNCHYWAEYNPHITVEKAQRKPKVTVWCGMTASRIVGPFIIRDTMNAERYLAMLQNDVWPVVSTWPNLNDLVFMQDGAPPHYATVVRNWLDRSFDQQWLGRAGPHEWPARSPDLTPCDFFLWGYVKEEVYKTNPKTLDQLETAIRNVIGAIPIDHLNKSCESVRDRIGKLKRNGGGHIEY